MKNKKNLDKFRKYVFFMRIHRYKIKLWKIATAKMSTEKFTD